ncbi:hypothetical protein C7B61_00320 [filamentous cyanobacterium CCP1]|nr:hypothetical protein C7B76_16740 [filamentous cyanobacterium CCP2]PSB68555.1 hypothetical protein C7B61_00320 [filamentous cyanobacterium CCP1]
MTAVQLPEVTADRVFAAIDAILEVLGSPETEAQRAALAAFNEGDSAKVKRLSSCNLADSYLRCLGYLVSAKNNPKLPTIDTLLSESARAAADLIKDRTLAKLSQELDRTLNT